MERAATMQTGTRQDDWTISGLLRRSGFWVIASVAVGSLSALSLTFMLIVLGSLTDRLTFHNASFAMEKSSLILLMCLLASRLLTQWLADCMADHAALKLTSEIRADLLRHMFKVGPAGLTGLASGEIVTTMTDGVDALRPFLARYIPRAAMMVVLPLMILAAVLHADFISFVILVITGPLIPIFMILVGYRAQAIMDRQWKQFLCLGASFLDFLRGMTTLRLFGRDRDATQAVATLADTYRKTTMSVMKVAFLTTASLEFFASLSVALIAVILGSRLLHGTADFRAAFIVLLLTPEYFAPLRAFSASYHARQNAISALDRIRGLFALPEQATIIPESPEKGQLAAQISCTEMDFQYGDSARNVLTNVNCHFPRHHLTIITGDSGAGKSTLLRLLIGELTPSSGAITVSDTEGRSIPESWRAQIGWIPQHPHLFFGSIADNLRAGNPGATLSELKEAALQAHAFDFIEKLPQGFETRVGESGYSLSGGQIQRLALARALLRNPTILIMDEPTAGLDAASEQKVLQAIIQNVPGRIVIVATHRKAIINAGTLFLHVANGLVSERIISGESAA
ncbi:MAG: thiol reductant ABC exporter subunit CydD [Acetobacter sp.]|jgi:ATP-binding cassette subfamily C protein CydD